LSARRALGPVCAALLLWLAGLATGVPAMPHLRVVRGAGDPSVHVACGMPELALRHAAPMLRVVAGERDGAGGASSGVRGAARHAEEAAPARWASVLRVHRDAHVCELLRHPYDAHAPPGARALA
jgi:hypothetical protein